MLVGCVSTLNYKYQLELELGRVDGSFHNMSVDHYRDSIHFM